MHSFRSTSGERTTRVVARTVVASCGAALLVLAVVLVAWGWSGHVDAPSGRSGSPVHADDAAVEPVFTREPAVGHADRFAALARTEDDNAAQRSGPSDQAPEHRAAQVVGTVYDARGLPVAAAVVRAVAVGAQRLRADDPGAITETGADGAFAMNLHDGVRYELHAEAGGMATPAAMLVADAREVARVDLRMLGAITISGTVILPNGGPAVGATVTAWCEARSYVWRTGARVLTQPCGTSGAFHIDVPSFGAWTVLAASPGLANSRAVVVDVEPRAAHAQATLWLEPLVSLRGRVVDVDGAPVASAQVEVVKLHEGPALVMGRPPPDALHAGGGTVETGADGAFEVAVQAGSSWQVVASLGSQRCVRNDVVAGASEVVLVLGGGRPLLRGSVHRHDGLAIGDYGVALVTRTGPVAFEQNDVARIDGAVFEFELPTRGTAGVEVVVTPATDELAPCRYGPFVSGDEAIEHRFVLQPWGTVPVQVLDSAGVALAGAHVVIGGASGTTLADGTATLERCAPGTARLVIWREQRCLLRREVAIGPGANAQVRVQVP